MNKSQEHAQFVMRNEKANYPDVTSDNLQVWYDVKGKKDTDFYKDTLIDLSGNGKDATVHNFAFEKRSGYLDDGGLIFDDVDDKLVYPSVKDEVEYTSASRNLFDISKIEGRLSDNGGTVQGVRSLVLTHGGGRIYTFEGKTGVQYALQIKYLVDSTSLGIGYIQFEYSDGTNSVYKHPLSTFQDWKTLGVVSEAGKTVVALSTSYSNTGKTYIDINNIQLEEGSTATPYTPYVPLPIMTYQYNGNILSYEADGTVKRVDDGKVIERKGINLVRNGNFADGTKWWFTTNGISEMSRSDTGGVELSLLNNLATHARISQDLSINSSIGTALYFKIKVTTLSENINHCRVFLRDGTGGSVIANRTSQIYNQVMGQTYELEAIAVNDAELVNNTIYVMADFYRKGDTTEKLSVRIEDIQVINLTEAYGAGNEPTLDYIKAHPEEFAWTPNPNDLIEAHEIKNNLVGDLEDLHGTGDKTEILSGTEIFTDKADDSVVHVDVDGKSYQHSGSGKNLISGNTENILIDAVGSPYYSLKIRESLKSNIDYTFSIKGILKENSRGWRVWMGPNSHTNLGDFLLPVDGISTITRRFTTEQVAVNDGTFRIYPLAIEASTRTVAEIETIQLEIGSTATAYEPPAPTPDYPIEIHSLNDFDVVSSVGKENLLTSDKINTFSLSYEKEGGKYTLDTYPTRGDVYTSGIKISESLFSVGERYSLSFKVKKIKGNILDITGHSPAFGNTKVYLDGNLISNSWSNGGAYPNDELEHEYVVYGTFTGRSGDSNLYIQPNRVNKYIYAYVAEIWNLKVEKDDKTPYSPPANEINSETTTIYKSNILLNQPLRSVGDVKDRLFRDSDGLWKIERKIGEHIFEGTEDFRLSSSRTNTTLFNYSGWYSTQLSGAFSSAETSLNSHFAITQSSYSYDIEGQAGSTATSGMYISIRKSIATSVSELKAWLVSQKNSGTPMIVYFAINPTVETLPQADQDKLNNIASYKDSNYLYTVVDKTNILPSYVRDNLKPNLNAKFRKLSWFWSRLLFYQLKIWSKNLTDDELIHEYKINKRRWGM